MRELIIAKQRYDARFRVRPQHQRVGRYLELSAYLPVPTLGKQRSGREQGSEKCEQQQRLDRGTAWVHGELLRECFGGKCFPSLGPFIAPGLRRCQEIIDRIAL